MSKYIDVDVALQIWKEKDFIKLYSQEAKVKGMLALVPAADVEPVVRCKDCKWHDNCEGFCHNPVWGDGHANYMPPIIDKDGYCSCGELKEQKDGKDTDSDSDM